VNALAGVVEVFEALGNLDDPGLDRQTGDGRLLAEAHHHLGDGVHHAGEPLHARVIDFEAEGDQELLQDIGAHRYFCASLIRRSFSSAASRASFASANASRPRVVS
jgi:hypothetical protein